MKHSESAAVGTTAGAGVKFTLLGPLEVLKDGNDHAPSAPKLVQLLALLLLRPGKVVQNDSIIFELWSDRPPRSVRTTMQTYVYKLRQCIEENALAPSGEALLVTKPHGYLFDINPAQVDVFAFHEHCDRGHVLLKQGRNVEAATTLSAALALWSGPPLANVTCGPVLSSYAVDLHEQHRNAQHLRIQADIEAGRHRDVIGELRSLIANNPLDESLHIQLMRVLSRCGRRPDALGVYLDLRRRLNDELGVEPCGEMQQLHQALLRVGEPRIPTQPPTRPSNPTMFRTHSSLR